MSDVAICVEGLGKRYRIGERQTGYKTFRDSAAAAASRSVRALGKVFSRNGHEPNGARPDDFWALRDVSFEVKHGEVVAVIGRNGAGKSTLLKILSRITEPTEGRVTVNGRVGSLLEVGTGFHPELTGRENIYLNGAILGMTNAEIARKFDEIVMFAEMERFLDTPVKRYSSGMQLRLGFSVAAHLEHEILVVDEVLAVGDASFQRKCLGKMQDVATESRTVVFVTHNMPAVLNLCDRALVLNGGALDCDTSANNGVDRYLEIQQSMSTIALGVRNDRRGNQVLRFIDVQYRDLKGSQIPRARSGQDVVIVLRYDSELNQPLHNVQIGIDVCGRFDERLFNLATTWVDGDRENLPPSGEIHCIIRCLPLLPGNYSLDLFAGVGGEMADFVRTASTLNVGDEDFYGSGKLPVLGSFLVPHSWDVVPLVALTAKARTTPAVWR